MRSICACISKGLRECLSFSLSFGTGFGVGLGFVVGLGLGESTCRAVVREICAQQLRTALLLPMDLPSNP